jgi:amino acid transporter
MWKKQSKRRLINQLDQESELKRCLNSFDLLCYGLGANIGSNFFLFIGELLKISGPSICISFFVGGVISMITAICFAELGSRIPTNGGQYSYVYIYYGECLGWM